MNYLLVKHSSNSCGLYFSIATQLNKGRLIINGEYNSALIKSVNSLVIAICNDFELKNNI